MRTGNMWASNLFNMAVNSRPVLLGSSVDIMVQKYLKKVRDVGVVSARIVKTTARGILLSNDEIKLVEFGGYVQLSRHWAYVLLKRMKFVHRQANTAKSKHAPVDFEALKKAFLADVVLLSQWRKSLQSLFWTGTKEVLRLYHPMHGQGSKRALTE